jgi:hypothetical protein
MLYAKRSAACSDSPMSIAQALKHQHAEFFMEAFAEEISSLKEMKTFVEY